MNNTELKKSEVKVPYFNNFLILEPFGQYNFIRIRMELGETPAELKNEYFTNYRMAEVRANEYIGKQKVQKKKD